MPPIGITRRGVASGKLPPQAQAILEWAEENDWQTTKDSPGFVADALGDHTGKDTLHTSYDIGSLTRGLVAYYPMDEGGGDVVHDGALANLGQINGASWNGSGQVGSDALSFDGTDDTVKNDTLSFSPTQYTVSAWINLVEKSSAQYALEISRESDGFSAITFRHDNNNDEAIFSQRNSSDNSIQATTGWTYGTNSWVHLAGVWDGSSINLYINGSEKATKSISSIVSTDNISIGGRYNDSDYFNGLIDDLRIYDRVLSQPEIEALYNRTAPSGREVTESDVPTQSDNGVSRYEFENDVTDSWGSNDGTDNTSAGYVTGVFGDAKDFDGTDDYIDVPNNWGLSVSSDFTVSLWLNVNDLSNSYTAMGLWDGTDDLWFIRVEDGSATPPKGAIQTSFGHNGANFIDLITNTTISSDDWYHYTITWTASSNTGRVYLNGSQDSSNSSTVDDPFDDTENTDIGQRSDGNKNFNGAIDDVRIYSKALSPTEVESLYNKGSWRIERGAVL